MVVALVICVCAGLAEACHWCGVAVSGVRPPVFVPLSVASKTSLWSFFVNGLCNAYVSMYYRTRGDERFFATRRTCGLSFLASLHETLALPYLRGLTRSHARFLPTPRGPMGFHVDRSSYVCRDSCVVLVVALVQSTPRVTGETCRGNGISARGYRTRLAMRCT